MAIDAAGHTSARNRARAYFDQELADVFGFNAFQLGLPEFDFLRANRMPHRWVTGTDGPVGLQSDLCALPIQSAVADLVVLPHALEFSEQSASGAARGRARADARKGTCRDRGFNPWSLWGVRRLVEPRARRLSVARPVHQSAANQGLAALLELRDSRAAACAATRRRCAPRQWLRRFSFMEEAGDRWWPICRRSLFPGGSQAGARHAHDQAEMEDRGRRRKRAGCGAAQDATVMTSAMAARTNRHGR